MPRETSVNGYESFRYEEVSKVTEWKDGCIYKTKSVGYIQGKHRDLLPAGYTTSSIPTYLSIKTEFTIPVMTLEEVRSLE